jgi:hypothetical protein
MAKWKTLIDIKSGFCWYGTAADGLDRGHVNAISGLTVQIDAGRIIIHCDKIGSALEELHYGKAKADLLVKVLGRTVDIV